MKYRLIEKPTDSIYPLIVPKRFRNANVERVIIHDNDDYEDIESFKGWIATVPNPNYEESRKASLAIYNDKNLEELSHDIDVPIKELKQIQELILKYKKDKESST